MRTGEDDNGDLQDAWNDRHDTCPLLSVQHNGKGSRECSSFAMCQPSIQKGRTGWWCYGRRTAAATRLSPILKERLPEKREIDVENHNRVQTARRLTVMGCTLFTTAVGGEMARKANCESRRSVMRRRMSHSSGRAQKGQTNRRFDGVRG